ncbi:MAG TPA: aminotransferase class III-fold pyridoxal phosphate-dependent enzyme [Candidatus Limnocylindrales bacterium]|nr:aminotransferase class III-fold pyridoxal phosphate-dependent enzyme [Candidatus Limnocylindrales bacterium]
MNSDYRHGSTPTQWAWAGGSRMRDVDGNEVIDYMLGMGPHILGHAPPAVLDAVRASLGEGQLYAGQHPREVELAERLVELIPSVERVRFLMSGTEATALAVRLARAATGRRLLLKFEGHYHGWQDGIFVGSHPAYFKRGYPGLHEAWPEAGGQDPEAFRQVVVAPWNDPAALDRILDEVGDQVAGILMEPIMCNSAVIDPAAGYLDHVRAACDRLGIVLIFDEIITGFRVALRGAQGLLNVKPDLTCYAKALGGGFPISCVGGSGKVMDLLGDPRVAREQPTPMHGGTFNTFVPSVAASLATLDELERPDVYERFERLGRRLMNGIGEALAAHAIPHVIQGYGAAFYVDLNGRAPRSVRDVVELDHQPYRELVQRLEANGVRTHARGVWYLSTAHTESDIDATIQAVRRSL